MKSYDKELRDNLAVYLSEKNLLCPDELEAWDMLKLIETVLQSKSVQNIRWGIYVITDLFQMLCKMSFWGSRVVFSLLSGM